MPLAIKTFQRKVKRLFTRRYDHNASAETLAVTAFQPIQYEMLIEGGKFGLY